MSPTEAIEAARDLARKTGRRVYVTAPGYATCELCGRRTWWPLPGQRCHLVGPPCGGRLVWLPGYEVSPDGSVSPLPSPPSSEP